jgi:hypothetical protein
MPSIDLGASRRWVIWAVDPHNHRERIEVTVSHRRLRYVARLGRGPILESAELLPYTLQQPSAVFKGLRRHEDDDAWGYGWLCYCSVPQKAFTHAGTECEPRSGQVYLAFVNEDRVAYNWRSEKADPTNETLPLNWSVRFKERVL